MTSIHHNLWTPRDTDILCDMLKDGKGYVAIAKKLKRTRNAVIGKTHRLGLCEPREPLRGISKPRSTRTMPIVRKMAFVAPVDQPKPVPKKPEPNKGVSLFDIKKFQCREIIGEDKEVGLIFCGKPAERTWCEEHSSKNVYNYVRKFP